MSHTLPLGTSGTRPSAARKVRRCAILAVTAAIVAASLSPGSANARAHTPLAPAGPPCSLSMSPGTHTVALMSDGVSRPFELYVPQRYDGHTPIPVVVNGHGSTSWGAEQLAYSAMRPVADRYGFAIAAPTGAVEYTRGYVWNFPGFPLFGGTTQAPAGTPDDDLMVRDLIAQVKRVICTDSRRVYATGFSAGGRMASRLACTNAGLVAAIGAVGGLRAGSEPDPTDCHPSRPVPVIGFHGDADPINKFGGGSGTATSWGYGVKTAVKHWVSINRCNSKPLVETVTPTVDRETYKGCAKGSAVVFHTLKGGGHTWPGSGFPLPADEFGRTDMSINASELMWQFFARHRLPAPAESCRAVSDGPE